MLHHYLVPLGYWMLQVTRHWFEPGLEVSFTEPHYLILGILFA